MALTAKQERFALEYVVDLCVTQAAIRAGYSRRSAAEIGYENLRKPQVAERIAQLVEKRNERLQVDGDWVLQKLKSIVDRDPDGSRNRVPVRDLLRALELIGKHVDVGAFRERVQVTRDQDLIDAIMSARKRARAHGHLLEADESGPDERLN